MNARFIWENRHFDAATLSAHSAAAGYPVTCLQDKMRSRKWRSTGLSGEYVQAALGAAKPINCIVLIDHNLTFAGTVTVTASNSPGGSDLVNLTTDAWQELIGYGEDRWGFMGYGGGFFDEADRSYMVPRPIRVIYLADHGYSDVVEAAYIRLAFSDAANPDGYVEMGRMFACLYTDFGINFSGIAHEPVDDSDNRLTIGGQNWSQAMPVRDSIALSFDLLEYGDKYWNLLHASRKLGTREPFVIDCFPDPEMPSQRHFGTLYGRFREMPTASQDGNMGFLEGRAAEGYRVSSAELAVEEVL